MADFLQLHFEAKIKEPRPPYKDYRELTNKEKREIKKLVVSMCANYDNYYKECLLLGVECPLFRKMYHTGKLCHYFRNAVLPLNKELELSLIFGAEADRTCGICGRRFHGVGRQKYCGTICAGEAEKKANRLRKREQRQK